jgi:hypothetical protein
MRQYNLFSGISSLEMLELKLSPDLAFRRCIRGGGGVVAESRGSGCGP